ncbi:pyrophosphatase [Ferroglobus placidus DSM 10642]|uniref:Pyrophosphatase n=1 Tax=Ferroglobus placidus (strain DSM 10642 / AEDII12DO) TaxID=589924 RepID=D3S1F9_FERPA|nr:nucleotide pyrophosphohydrolase [Ferroglobus placidus]ADC66423.1 pyrophosphatase [Ferroglobus placidus DSM 10642]
MLKVVERVLKFRDERGWKKYHNPKDLAASIVIEASELLEIFQWVSEEESYEEARRNIERVKEEVADILIYLIYLADVLQIDLEEAVIEKLKKNEEKYPIR